MIPLILSYLAAGLLAYSGYLAYARREWPDLNAGQLQIFNEPPFYSENLNGALAAGVCGWLGLVIVAFETEWFKHGLKWT